VPIFSVLRKISPEILPYEIGNALSAMIKRKKLSKDEALQVQKKLKQFLYD